MNEIEYGMEIDDILINVLPLLISEVAKEEESDGEL